MTIYRQSNESEKGAVSKLTDCIAVFPIEIFGDNLTVATE